MRHEMEPADDPRPVSPHPPTPEERIANALERIALVLEDELSDGARARAIQLWSIGQGRHPDD